LAVSTPRRRIEGDGALRVTINSQEFPGFFGPGLDKRWYNEAGSVWDRALPTAFAPKRRRT